MISGETREDHADESQPLKHQI
eukprot:gene26636-biopygen17047